jgi:hypothetical protein
VAPYVPTGDIRFLPRDVQRYEPRWALDGGPDGLALVREVVVAAGRLLRPGGWLLMEVGGRQDQLLNQTLEVRGFDGDEVHVDTTGAPSFADQRILSPATVALMTADRLTPSQPAATSPAPSPLVLEFWAGINAAIERS